MENKRIVEALLFANDGPLDISRIKVVLDGISAKEIKKHIANINDSYKESGSPFEIIEVAGLITFVGSNLLIIDKNLPHADPEASQGAGNIQGWQSGVMPTTRNYGFSLNIQL